MKSTFLVPAMLVSIGLLVVAGYFMSARVEVTDTKSMVEPVAPDVLIVRAQEISSTITIEYLEMSQDGFAILRSSDGKRLGQIIEISQYLKAGRYENIKIPLGNFYDSDESDRPIVMLYRDDGDASFTGLDQPVTDAKGSNWGVFVHNGEVVPASVFAKQVAPNNGVGLEKVLYTNTGFSPASLSVPLGTVVEFVNQSDNNMWVASDVHPSHEILPTFDQFSETGRGTSYIYTFDQTGIWRYHDHINAAFEGVIVVE